MVKFNPITVTITMLCFNSFSQTKETKSNFSLSGSVDTYYTTNLSSSDIGTTGILSDNSANGFGLGMANAVISYEKEKIGAVADLAFGPRANAANAYDGAINQLYVYYQATDDLKFTLGQFNTFFGYEVIAPAANFNYSVSYLFNAGPFSHTGLKVDYTASEDLSFMLAVTNPHIITAGTNPTDDYQLGFQTGYKGQYLNLVYGADGSGFKDFLYLDYTGGFDITDDFYLGINGAYANSDDADSGYYGVALYLQKEFKNDFSLGLRPEFFTTTSAAGDLSQSAFTLTLNKSIMKNLKVITELRYDTSDDVTFFNDKSITGVTLAAIYSFE
ncbi:Putative beta-barrel porin-2, OmpL-like. bbp2 [Tenacibaculum sp. MAR_2009_124]|uniref:outer membrane beta-barrel protein n=1 Tax=Tenacibaculum sp. MAR_2009_124 TaxID=1250059 RepID=UPI00089D260F|nr:outer membrane beta-barrel protein [Tenacibaculum sp. MAR_2009_124]SEB68797.1 Putative beta-barrel porin-2, OmpL-like. bbp2 [Tenacibaculum sp. MAR_2009_124]